MVSFVPIVYRLQLTIPVLIKIYKDHRKSKWNTHPFWMLVLLWKIPGGKLMMWSILTGFLIPVNLLYYDLASLTSRHFGWESWTLTPWWSRFAIWGFLVLFFRWDSGTMTKAKGYLKDFNKALKSLEGKTGDQSITEKLAFTDKKKKPKAGGFRSRVNVWVDKKLFERTAAIPSSGPQFDRTRIKALSNSMIGDQPSVPEEFVTLWIAHYFPIVFIRIVVFMNMPLWYLYAFLFFFVIAAIVVTFWIWASSRDYVNPPSFELFKQFIVDNFELDKNASLLKSSIRDSINDLDQDKIKAKLKEAVQHSVKEIRQSVDEAGDKAKEAKMP